MILDPEIEKRLGELMAKCERESAETRRMLDTLRAQVTECRKAISETQDSINKIIGCIENLTQVGSSHSQRIATLETRLPKLVLEEKLYRRNGILINPWTNPAPSPPINPTSPNPDSPKL